MSCKKWNRRNKIIKAFISFRSKVPSELRLLFQSEIKNFDLNTVHSDPSFSPHCKLHILLLLEMMCSNLNCAYIIKNGSKFKTVLSKYILDSINCKFQWSFTKRFPYFLQNIKKRTYQKHCNYKPVNIFYNNWNFFKNQHYWKLYIWFESIYSSIYTVVGTKEFRINLDPL